MVLKEHVEACKWTVVYLPHWQHECLELRIRASTDVRVEDVRVTSSFMGLAVLHGDLALGNAALVRHSSEASDSQHSSCGA